MRNTLNPALNAKLLKILPPRQPRFAYVWSGSWWLVAGGSTLHESSRWFNCIQIRQVPRPKHLQNIEDWIDIFLRMVNMGWCFIFLHGGVWSIFFALLCKRKQFLHKDNSSILIPINSICFAFSNQFSILLIGLSLWFLPWLGLKTSTFHGSIQFPLFLTCKFLSSI